MPSPNRHITIDDVDKRPALPSRSPHAIISGADFERATQPPLVAYLPWPAWVVFGVLIAGFGGALLYWLIGALRRWAESSAFAEWLALFLPAAAVGTIVCVGLYWLAGKAYYSIMATRANAYQASLTRWRLGTPVAADQIAHAPLGLLLSQEQAANTLETDRAPYTKYPVLASLSEGNHEEAHTEINGIADEPQAPAGVPSGDWLRWIDETPHLMIAGRTNAGKTTLASAILAERIQGGDEVLVIDPHDQPDKWYGIQAVGGGRQYGAILATLDQVIAEMDARYQAFKTGTPTSAFSRLTVLVDEVPAIMDACLNERRKMIDARWSNFARQLGSEARKVRISVILLTQSVLVQDIGINTAMRKNFSRIALGDETRRLLNEEENHERRTHLAELIRGQQHPAVMEYCGEIHVLNTADVPQLAQQDVRGLVSVWKHNTPIAPDPSVSVQTDSRQTWDRAKKQAVIAQLRVAGLTRDQARARLAKVGQGLDNDDWAAADPSRIEAL